MRDYFLSVSGSSTNLVLFFCAPYICGDLRNLWETFAHPMIIEHGLQIYTDAA